jgi:hypothetical protein
MDAVVTKCLLEGCNKPLPAHYKRPKKYCSYACRAQHRKGGVMAERVNIPDPPTPLNNDTENQGVTTPFLDGADQPDNLRFEQVNACTWKLTDGSMTITPTPPGRQWEGHKTTRALAWLMGLGHGKWLARYRDQAIGPSAFNKAKADVLKMVRREARGDRLINPITYANKLQTRIEELAEYEVTVLDRRRPYVDLLNIGRKYKQRIVETECGGDTTLLVQRSRAIAQHGPTPGAVQGDHYPIEMDADGDPILPACLDRRPKRAMAEAA